MVEEIPITLGKPKKRNNENSTDISMSGTPNETNDEPSEGNSVDERDLTDKQDISKVSTIGGRARGAVIRCKKDKSVGFFSSLQR